MKKALIFLALWVNLAFGLHCGNLDDDIVGYWLSPRDEVSGRTSIVEIIKKDGKYYGYIVAFMDTMKGANDERNEHFSLRERPILGTVFIYNLERNAQNSYIKGRYYDFNAGKSFHLRAKSDCKRLSLLVSVDNLGVLGSRKVYEGLSKDEAKIYIEAKPEPDFSGVK